MNKMMTSEKNPQNLPVRKSPANPWRKIVFGALLPILAFTWLEESYGLVWGLVGAIAFSTGEIILEYWREKRISYFSGITFIAIFVLGGISLLAQDGIWYKLQPALFELGMALVIVVFGFRGKPFLLWLMEQQGQHPAEFLRARFAGISWRLAIFFFLQSAVTAWAAYFWSTLQWGMVKGIGFFASFFLYFGLEIFFLRRVASRQK